MAVAPHLHVIKVWCFFILASIPLTIIPSSGEGTQPLPEEASKSQKFQECSRPRLRTYQLTRAILGDGRWPVQSGWDNDNRENVGATTCQLFKLTRFRVGRTLLVWSCEGGFIEFSIQIAPVVPVIRDNNDSIAVDQLATQNSAVETSTNMEAQTTTMAASTPSAPVVLPNLEGRVLKEKEEEVRTNINSQRTP